MARPFRAGVEQARFASVYVPAMAAAESAVADDAAVGSFQNSLCRQLFADSPAARVGL